MRDNAHADLKYFQTNNVTAVEPRFDVKKGYQYSELNHGRTLSEQLSSLAEYQRKSWVRETGAITVLQCPQCRSENLCVAFQCQLCASPNISRGSAVQHDRCGNVDFDYNFVDEDSSMHCKKCNKDMKAIGVDYSRLGSYFKCHKCNVLLPTISHAYQCFDCGKASNEDEMLAARLPTYSIDREVITGAVDTTADLDATVKQLEGMGIKAVQDGSITGLSRISHQFALIIYDQRDLPLLAADVAAGGDRSLIGKDLLSFIAKCGDAKIRNKAIITVNCALDADLRELAEINGIAIIECDGEVVPDSLINCVKDAVAKSVQVA